MRTLRALAALTLLAAGLAGCSGGSRHSAVGVHGTIETVGGDAPGAPRPIPGARFRLVGDHTSVAVQADRRGRFGVALAPGTYRVEMTGHAPMSDGSPLPARPGTFRVTSRSSAPVRLVVDVR